METKVKKVKVIEFKPHQVRVMDENGIQQKYPKLFFKTRLDMGMLEVENPDMLPWGI